MPRARVIAIVLTLLAIVAAASAFLAARFAPSVDLPAHLALVRVLHALGDGGVLDQHYQLGTFPAPNSLVYGVGFVISALTDLRTTGVVLFFLAPVVVLAGFAFLLVALRRAVWMALAIVPFVVQWPLLEGFIDYYYGIGCFFVALGCLVRWSRAPSRARLLLVVVSATLVFFAHVHAMLFFGIAATLFLALHRQRALVGAAAAFGPIVLLTCAWLLLGHSASALSGKSLGVAADLRVRAMLDDGPLSLEGARGGEVVLLGLIVLGLSLAAAHAIPRDEHPPDERRTRLFLGTFTSVCLVALMSMPNNIGSYWSIHVRFVPMIWFTAVALLAPRETVLASGWAGDWKRRVLVVASVAPLVFGVVFTRVAWSASVSVWNDFTAGFEDVLASAPRERQAMFVSEAAATDRPDGFRAELWKHLGQYYTALDDGLTTFSFGMHPGRLVEEAPRRDAFLERGTIADLTRLRDLGCSDVVLQLGASDLTRKRDDLALITRSGDWAVYRAPACD